MSACHVIIVYIGTDRIPLHSLDYTVIITVIDIIPHTVLYVLVELGDLYPSGTQYLCTVCYTCILVSYNIMVQYSYSYRYGIAYKQGY